MKFIENPAHKRSHLIYAAPKGESLVEKTNRKEREILKKIDIDIEAGDMLKAAEVLQSVKRFFESQKWKDVLKKSNL